MKTRVREEINQRGDIYYIPQYRLFWIWFDFKNTWGSSLKLDKLEYAIKHIQLQSPSRVIKYHKVPK